MSGEILSGCAVRAAIQLEVDAEERSLREDRARLDWLAANPNAIQHCAMSGFVYWPSGEAAIYSNDLREAIDKARHAQAAIKNQYLSGSMRS